MKKFAIISITLVVLSYLVYSCIDLKPNVRKSKISGIDVSHYQGVIEWDKVRESVDFVYIKATEGGTLKDSKFNRNWRESKRNGVKRGAYHFFTPNVSAYEQFINFKNSVKLSPGDLPPVLDVEREAGVYTKLDIDMDEVNEWLRLVEEYYGVKPIIYSDYITFKFFMDDKVNNYKLWIYLPKGYFLKPSFNDYDCVIWQYSYKGKIDGIKGNTDLDEFYGDSNEFENLLIK